MSSDQALTRAIAGALRSAIRDHGPITPDQIGSAAKRVVGNLQNRAGAAAAAAGEGAVVCRDCGAEVDSAHACRRCGYEFRAITPPKRCPSCKTTHWDKEAGAVPRGRPRKRAAEE